METVKIGETIQVLAVFKGGRLRPLRFQWQNRTYRIERINGSWIDRQLEQYDLLFSVQIGDETYCLRFASRDLRWWLDEMTVL